jgi:hypothetical protein
MFLKKGLRDSSLSRKLTMKNPRMSKEMLAIANKYALAKEATLDAREQKKDQELCHLDQPSTYKSDDKKRKVDRSVNNVERPHRNKEYHTKPSEFECFLDRICISTRRESTRPGTMTDSTVLQMRFSRRPKMLIKRRSPKIQRAISPKLTRRSTTS